MQHSWLRDTPSRRSFLKQASAAALALRWPRMAQAQEGKPRLAYVGTYTGAPGNGGNGEGIYRFEVDARTGLLSERTLVAETPSPSWICIHPSKRYLYAVNEVANPPGGSGSVSAFAIEPSNGDLKLLNTVSSQGGGPAYVSLDASGSFALVANYGGGSIAVLPVLADGRLGEAVDVHRDEGLAGRPTATDAPAGSFSISGHDAPHMHMVAVAQGNRMVFASDLGQDRIYIFAFDPATGKLSQSGAAPFAALPSGDGPRHFALHPNGRWLYSIQEEASTVTYFQIDARGGSLVPRQSVSTLPASFAGTSFASEVLISPDGRFLYAANRLHDSIAVFAIGTEGRLRSAGEVSTYGDYPGQCRIDPAGAFFYACNRRSDCITSFRMDARTGMLAFTGQYAAVGSPASITFLS
jgi:6-phosphogluconolactonase (cycloisomerase 2 family)